MSRRRSAQGGLRVSRVVPEATVARLPVYLRALTALHGRAGTTVSSDGLAAAAGVNSAKVRKDLSYLGSYGVRGVGYEVDYLRYQISRVIGLTHDWPVVIIGVGNLGHALGGYSGFATRGFRVAALLDSDVRRTGDRVGDLPVRPFEDLADVVADHGPCIGVITTPAEAAQDVADRLVAAGVRSILNFAPTVLSVPDDVEVRQVDLALELQILAYHERCRPAAAQATAAPRLAPVRPA